MLPIILQTLKSKGHKVFTRGDYNLNIIGVRAPGSANHFDDAVIVCYKVGSSWITRQWSATTDPGTYYRLSPMNPQGTAILVPGQYSSYKIDLHSGSYEALCQRRGTVKVYRDNNKDDILDHVEDEEGWFGINIHRAHSRIHYNNVNKFSAGCQVFENVSDFSEFMSLCHKSARLYGNAFTYTLIEL